MQFAVAQKVIGVVMASSPGPKPAANAAPCNAAVPELKLTAYRAPTHAAKRSSNSPIFGPVVNQSDLRASTTACTSASSKLCRPYGNNSLRTGVPPWMANISSFLGKVLMPGKSYSAHRTTQSPEPAPQHSLSAPLVLRVRGSASVRSCRWNIEILLLHLSKPLLPTYAPFSTGNTGNSEPVLIGAH